jgi:pimeloyl-ACP methyl ester carboxylesterase
MPYLEMPDQTRLYYETRGRGKPIVLVHGWTMSHSLWENQIFALSKENRVISLDLRGHGDSDKPDCEYSMDQFARDIHTVLEQLDLHDTTLVGWSMGTWILARYATLFAGERVSGLGLVCGMPSLLSEPGYLDGAQLGTWSQERCNDYARRMIADRPGFAQWFNALMFHRNLGQPTVAWVCTLTAKTPMWVAFDAFTHIVQTDNRGILHQIKIPTIVLHGRYDAVCAYEAGEYFAQHIPNARITTFEQSGHCPFIEEVETFNKALVEFVDRIE